MFLPCLIYAGTTQEMDDEEYAGLFDDLDACKTRKNTEKPKVNLWLVDNSD